MAKKKQYKAEIISNSKIKEQYYKIVFASRVIAQSVLPGQFVMVRARDSGEVFLRRPLSAHRVFGGNVELFYEVVGKGTEILSGLKAGERIDVLGPLGNGFNYKLNVERGGPQILVAGGMGVAPLMFLAERLAVNRRSSNSAKISVFIGAKTKQLLLCAKEFKQIGCDVKIATDDGSQGFHGRVTELLEKALSTMNYQLSTIYACGPQPMLKEISRISCQNSVPAQVSLEAHLACGIGACLGCVVNTKDGYKRVCKEGPVFAAHELVW